MSKTYKKDKIILSASAISTLKMCSWRYRNSYYYGVRPAEQAEALRMGSIYHDGQEIILMKPEAVCRECAELMHPSEDCHICQGTGFLDDPIQAVIRMLNRRYSETYKSVDKKRSARERAIILYSLFAYQHTYQEQPFDIIATEIPFRLPMINPVTHKPVPGVFIDGKIDKLIRMHDTGRVHILEHKSTSSDVDPASDYWKGLRLDTQISVYVYAAQMLQAEGELVPYGIKPTDDVIADVLYDVWKKPGIKPKKLSAADCKKILVSGEYYGGEFEVVANLSASGTAESVTIDGDTVECGNGKPTAKQEKDGIDGAVWFYESDSMFGHRLYDQIMQEPDKWLARKPLARTPEEVVSFERELFSIAGTIRFQSDNDAWFHNEKQCDAFGKCPYRALCYSNIQVDNEHVPQGFVNIFERRSNGSPSATAGQGDTKGKKAPPPPPPAEEE